MSATDMYDCTHGPKSDCHACLVGELVEVLEHFLVDYNISYAALQRDDWCEYEKREIVIAARAVLEKAKLIEDCIPAEQAAEVAMDHGHD